MKVLEYALKCVVGHLSTAHGAFIIWFSSCRVANEAAVDEYCMQMMSIACRCLKMLGKSEWEIGCTLTQGAMHCTEANDAALDMAQDRDSATCSEAHAKSVFIPIHGARVSIQCMDGNDDAHDMGWACCAFSHPLHSSQPQSTTLADHPTKQPSWIQIFLAAHESLSEALAIVQSAAVMLLPRAWLHGNKYDVGCASVACIVLRTCFAVGTSVQDL